MTRPITILFILPSLKAGGAERVVSFIAQHIDRDRFKPILLIVGFKSDSAYSVENIETHFLNQKRVLAGVPGIFRKIRSLKPDMVMTSMAHLTAVTAIQSLFFRKTKFVAREANIKKITKQYHEVSLPFGGRTLHQWSYRLLDAIICQSKDMADELIQLHPNTEQKIRVINNPITKVPPTEISEVKNLKPHYITVGRLHKEKGHLRILEALQLLDFDFTYRIIGSGPHEALIKEKASELGLMDRIEWIDFTDDVESYLIRSDVFIQGSYAEGFPNALLESCAVGTPVIAYDCPGGTSEIIAPSVNGFLVHSETELREKLEVLLKQPLDRNNVMKSVHTKFSKSHIIAQYEAVFHKLLMSE